MAASQTWAPGITFRTNDLPFSYVSKEHRSLYARLFMLSSSCSCALSACVRTCAVPLYAWSRLLAGFHPLHTPGVARHFSADEHSGAWRVSVEVRPRPPSPTKHRRSYSHRSVCFCFSHMVRRALDHAFGISIPSQTDLRVITPWFTTKFCFWKCYTDSVCERRTRAISRRTWVSKNDADCSCGERAVESHFFYQCAAEFLISSFLSLGRATSCQIPLCRVDLHLRIDCLLCTRRGTEPRLRE